MSTFLIAFAVILFVCIFLKRVSSKLGVPVLLLFLLLGVVYGWTDTDFATNNGWVVNDICTVALIFIMFYGGFGTRWSSAKPIVVEAGLLATLGVFLTAALVGLFCHFVMKWGWIESLLMGSVISSTDAASCFSILRGHNLGLKGNTASLLEMESGSNDPMSYMLTTVMLSLLDGSITPGAVVWDIVAQLLFGAACGLVLAQIAVIILRRGSMSGSGYDSLFIVAVALVSYALPNLIGGNGYLSAYIVGIIMGNTKYKGRKSLIGFFDGITNFMQILIFFLLGMLAVPSKLLAVVFPALMIFIFLTVIARPLAVSGILAPFRKYAPNDLGLISFVGLRGAASLVFAIMIFMKGDAVANDIFSIVFCIVLVSIALQGSLIPPVAKLLKMTDENSDVLQTFSDFGESEDVSFGQVTVSENGLWAGKALKDLHLPADSLIVNIKRGNTSFIPDGDTVLQTDDKIIICSRNYTSDIKVKIKEHLLSKDSAMVGKKVSEYPKKDNSILVMIRRGEEKIIPNGDTVLQAGDMLMIMK